MEKLDRRKFLKWAGTSVIARAAMTSGLLTGCSPRQPTATEASAPTVIPTAESTAIVKAAPTKASTKAPAAMPTVTPTPTADGRKPEIVQTYPDVPSKVTHIHHTGVWDGETLVPGALRQMLDASITELTGLNDVKEAWASLFNPDERIAIKVNVLPYSRFPTHFPLVVAVTERLQEVGVPADQVVAFDRYTSELENAGYPVNRDGAGMRCYGTDDNYTAGWTMLDTKVKLSDILLSCDALINMPILKVHGDGAGISFAMKNHYGTFDRPQNFHHQRMVRGMAELNALPPIRDRTRLIVGDALMVVKKGWSEAAKGDSIFMSFDPVACDTVGLQVIRDVLTANGMNPAAAMALATPWLESGAELGLGTNNPEDMDLVDLTLG